MAGSAGAAEDKTLELLERLGNGEELAQAALAMGLNQAAAQASFRNAAEIVRRSLTGRDWRTEASLLDRNEMTVVEALEILSNHAGEATTAHPKEA
jgi:hypothetical protein